MREPKRANAPDDLTRSDRGQFPDVANVPSPYEDSSARRDPLNPYQERRYGVIRRGWINQSRNDELGWNKRRDFLILPKFPS